jgi:subtilisin family serine protease
VYQVSLIDGDFDPRRTVQPRFDRYAEVGYQGTSMAAPHVAGVAALLAAQGVTRPAAIEAALRRFARDLGAPGRDDEFGDGLIDAAAALRGRGIGVAR